MTLRDASGWTVRLNADAIARHSFSGAWRGITLAGSASERARQMPGRVAAVDGPLQISASLSCMRKPHGGWRPCVAAD